IRYPDLILQRIAAVRVLLFERGESLSLEPLRSLPDGCSRLHLNSQVIQRSDATIGRGIQCQIETRFCDVELRVAWLELDRLETEKRTIEANGLLEAWRVERDMNLHTAAPFTAD